LARRHRIAPLLSQTRSRPRAVTMSDKRSLPNLPVDELRSLADGDFERRLKLEELILNHQRAIWEDRWLVRMFPIIVSAAVSIVTIAISGTQLLSARFERESDAKRDSLRYEQEREAARIIADRQYRMAILDVITKNFERLTSGDSLQIRPIRAALETALPDSTATGVFGSLARATTGTARAVWTSASVDAARRADAEDRRANAEYSLAFYGLKVPANSYGSVLSALQGKGYKILRTGNLDEKPEWMADRSRVLYYAPGLRAKAVSLATELSALTGSTFDVQPGRGRGVSPGGETSRFSVHWLPSP
jgi:hypothetical protein